MKRTPHVKRLFWSYRSRKTWVLIVLHVKKELGQLRLISIARLYSSRVVDSLLFGKYTSEDITQFLWGPMSTSYNTYLPSVCGLKPIVSKILPTDKKSLGLIKNKTIQCMLTYKSYINYNMKVLECTTTKFAVLLLLEEPYDDGPS